MKLSLKFEDDPLNEDQHFQIMTAKVPITIFNQPFVSGIVATTTPSSSDFSFSLSTNFPSGPSLKLAYTPTASHTTTLPFSLSLKSGLGISGSPHPSPLVFSARFSLSPSYAPVPTFSLHFKPQFGHFSLHKSVFSDSNSDKISGSLTHHRAPSSAPSLKKSEIGNGFEAGDSSLVWQELKLEPFGGKYEGPNNITHANNNSFESHSNGGLGFAPERPLVVKNNGIYGVSPGIAVMARTAISLTKGLSLNLRWGLNFPGHMGLKMPSLTVNKIGLERIEEVIKNKQNADASDGDWHLLKSMCFWMRRDLEIVEKENKELKGIIDEMKMGITNKNHREGKNGGGKQIPQQHSSESSGEFERWRSKKNGKEDNGQRETKKSQNLASDVESELQKAIKAASS